MWSLCYPNIHEKMIITSSLTRHFGEVDSHSTHSLFIDFPMIRGFECFLGRFGGRADVYS